MFPGFCCGDSNRTISVLLVGLDGSGKTTILYKLVTGDSVTTVPTVGYNLETVKHKDISMELCDMGGQEIIRPMWQMYYAKSRGLIFVVDSSDRARIEEAKTELRRALENRNLKNAALLVMANKQVHPRTSWPQHQPLPPDPL